MNGGRLQLTISTAGRPQQIADLDISYQLLENYKSNPQSVINEHCIGNKWCHILPSNKKGQIMKVFRQLPSPLEDTGFASYKELKRYWKNTYGYRLPDTDDNMFYCQVYFKPIGSKLFTYPSVCIRREGYISQSRTGPSVCEIFITDIKQLLRSVCGTKLRLSTTPWNPELGTTTVDKYKSKLNVVTASSTNNSIALSSRVSDVSVGNVDTTAELPVQPMCNTKSEMVIKVTSKDDEGTHRKNSSIASIFSGATASLSSVRNDNTSKLPAFMKSLIVKKSRCGLTINKPQFSINVDSSSTGSLTKAANRLPGILKSSNTSATNNANLPSAPMAPKHRPLFKPQIQSIGHLVPSGTPQKRGMAGIPQENEAKKMKLSVSTPKPNIDVSALAANNKLSKANSASLIAWLKSKGIACKSKDRKSDLVAKVLNHMPQLEP